MIKPPLVAAIHDMSGFGRCSLTVAIPILSVMGIQCCPVPTAILSNHTGYKSFYFADFTDKIQDYYEQWLNLDLDFKTIYSGFLGSEKQVEMVINMISSFKTKQQEAGLQLPLVLVDPVMGDHGNVYTTYTPEMCNKMKNLVMQADIITPNLTEACILLDRPYCGEIITRAVAEEMVLALNQLGPETVVMTGVHLTSSGQKKVANFAYNQVEKQCYFVETDLIEPHFNGTGDVFASVLCGALVRGDGLSRALEEAADFVYKCAKFTAQQGGKVPDGVMFEGFLKDL